MPALTAAGIKVYALSYDEPEALQDFARAWDITYTLLPDPDSTIIRQFGILNTLIAADDHPWFGIPFPGTYVLDAAGTITHKFFENNLAVRVGPEQLLAAATGKTIQTGTAQQADLPNSDPADPLRTEVFLQGESLAIGVQCDLIARWQVPAGRHVYAQPAPAGSVPVNILLDEHPLLVTRPVIRPASEPHRLADADEVFEVHHGVVELRLPVTVNGTLTRDNTPTQIELTGQIEWQTCDDTVCDIPVKQAFRISVPLAPPVLPAIGMRADQGEREPNANRHFEIMRERHQKSDP